MKLKVWVEVLTRETLTEAVVEIPDAEWNAMTEAERVARKAAIYNDHVVEVANGGCEEVEA
jgi:hypothetical protein